MIEEVSYEDKFEHYDVLWLDWLIVQCAITVANPSVHNVRERMRGISLNWQNFSIWEQFWALIYAGHRI